MREHGNRGVMALFTVEEICEVLSVRPPAGVTPQDLKQRIRRVVTDSRLVRKGDLFIAFQGERFDAHTFVPKVLAQGAVCAIVQEDYRLPPAPKRTGVPVLLGVRDTLEAYQRLATHYRNRFPIPVIAITGSNGKTTTKEMVAQVVAQRWKTLKTEGNLNNRIGVPQTLFQLAPRHQAAVIEMGVDQQGQTTRLCEIARPTIGVITNIGPDHLEFFGSMEGSAQAKAELLDHLPQEGAVVLNADDEYFDYLAARAQCRVVAFGISPKAAIRAANIRVDEKGGTLFGLVVPGKKSSDGNSHPGAGATQCEQCPRGGCGRLCVGVIGDGHRRGAGEVSSGRDEIADQPLPRGAGDQRLLQRESGLDESGRSTAGGTRPGKTVDRGAGRHAGAGHGQQADAPGSRGLSGCTRDRTSACLRCIGDESWPKVPGRPGWRPTASRNCPMRRRPLLPWRGWSGKATWCWSRPRGVCAWSRSWKP
jgi:CheY-like chemotaxis protein